VKYIGAALIFTAGILAGACRAAAARRRVKTLYAVAAAVRIMKNEICQRLIPLPAAIKTAFSSPELRRFLEEFDALVPQIGETGFSDIWQSCCAKGFAELTDEELTCIMALGRSLGRYDAAVQGQAMDGCLRQLESAYAAESAACTAYCRTSMGIGASLGAMISITLL
jgi:stage III sporulation protein AB